MVLSTAIFFLLSLCVSCLTPAVSSLLLAPIQKFLFIVLFLVEPLHHTSPSVINYAYLSPSLSLLLSLFILSLSLSFSLPFPIPIVIAALSSSFGACLSFMFLRSLSYPFSSSLSLSLFVPSSFLLSTFVSGYPLFCFVAPSLCFFLSHPY